MRITSLTLETITESATGAVEFTFVPKRLIRFRAGQGGLIITARGGGSRSPPATGPGASRAPRRCTQACPPA
jgi:hypothetical protein